MKICKKCNIEKPIDNFHNSKGWKDGKYYHCKECVSIDKKKYYPSERVSKINKYKEEKINNPEILLFRNAKSRASKKKLPFNITLEDISIPKICPVLGIELSTTNNSCEDNSPTIDRFIPEEGYIKGNISVISARANRIKNDATISEIEKVYKWMRDNK